jgi:hypothetical protein
MSYNVIPNNMNNPNYPMGHGNAYNMSKSFYNVDNNNNPNKTTNKNYLNYLKDQVKQLLIIQIDNKPNKLQLNRERVREREEIEKLNSYNPFGKSGAGAPNRDNYGNIMATRRTIANDGMHRGDNKGYNNYGNQQGGGEGYHQPKDNSGYMNNNVRGGGDLTFQLLPDYMRTENNNTRLNNTMQPTYPNMGIIDNNNLSYNNRILSGRNDPYINNILPYKSPDPFSNFNYKNQYFNNNIKNTNVTTPNVDYKNYYNYNDYFDPKGNTGATTNDYKPRSYIDNNGGGNNYNTQPTRNNNTREVSSERQQPQNTDNGGSILPDHTQDDDLMNVNKLKYKSFLMQQMEDKKYKEVMRKKQEMEMDRLEEQKYYDFL